MRKNVRVLSSGKRKNYLFKKKLKKIKKMSKKTKKTLDKKREIDYYIQARFESVDEFVAQ